MHSFWTYTFRYPLRAQMLQLHSTTQASSESRGTERVTVYRIWEQWQEAEYWVGVSLRVEGRDYRSRWCAWGIMVEVESMSSDLLSWR